MSSKPPELSDVKMELDLILVQWSMSDDLRAALNHLKTALAQVSIPNPSEPLAAVRADTVCEREAAKCPTCFGSRRFSAGRDSDETIACPTCC